LCSSVFCYSDKIPEINNLRVEGFILGFIIPEITVQVQLDPLLWA
jgi:hypothetical protein